MSEGIFIFEPIYAPVPATTGPPGEFVVVRSVDWSLGRLGSVGGFDPILEIRSDNRQVESQDAELRLFMSTFLAVRACETHGASSAAHRHKHSLRTACIQHRLISMTNYR